jgi:hypothetical protein
MAKQFSCFTPGEIWPDDKGVHINAHGGGILYHEGVYFWLGEHKISGKAGNLAHVGVHCYSSRDLYNWKDEGIALAVSDDPSSDIAAECILERPKVIYNSKTHNFVMWFHLELKGQGYKTARAGIAVAKRPAGPYAYVHSIRPNKGCWPINATPAQKAAIHNPALMAEMNAKEFSHAANPDTPRYPLLARDYARGQASWDMTLFVDNDGQAYHVCSSEEDSTLHISLLSDDFMASSGEYVRVLENRWNEAPALCKRKGRYWLLSSDCTGWAPNSARSAVADSIWGRWTELGNPCEGVNPQIGLGSEKTFGGQSTFILPVHGKREAFIAMFDLWRPENAIDGRYLWLPIRFEDERYRISWASQWDLSHFDR